MATNPIEAGTVGHPWWRTRLVYLVPIAIFAVIAAAFAVGLTLDPKVLPSALIGKAVPAFDLPPVKGRTAGLSSKDLKGEVSLVNVFASWCVECRVEHPFLMELARQGVVPVHGLNYKDKPDDAANWLDTLGDPYTRTGADRDGRVAIDWGVYGVPETYVITKVGRIAHKQVGPITPKDLQRTILPLIERLRRE